MAYWLIGEDTGSLKISCALFRVIKSEIGERLIQIPIRLGPWATFAVFFSEPACGKARYSCYYFAFMDFKII